MRARIKELQEALAWQGPDRRVKKKEHKSKAKRKAVKQNKSVKQKE
ncbi:MAG: hypothetical protein LAO78_18300 [Acidobacteriia bacterium]|nr:hypothetical protein [Terriglobia bacterium]